MVQTLLQDFESLVFEPQIDNIILLSFEFLMSSEFSHVVEYRTSAFHHRAWLGSYNHNKPITAPFDNDKTAVYSTKIDYQQSTTNRNHCDAVTI